MTIDVRETREMDAGKIVGVQRGTTQAAFAAAPSPRTRQMA